MAVVLPEVGRTAFMSMLGDSTEYVVLGPFAVGAFLRRMWFSVSASAPGVLIVGAALGPSMEATEVAFRAGAPLIDSSDQLENGQPVVVFQVAAGVSPQMVVPCGRRVNEGARYVVVCMVIGAAPAIGTLVVSIEVLRVSGGGLGAVQG